MHLDISRALLPGAIPLLEGRMLDDFLDWREAALVRATAHKDTLARMVELPENVFSLLLESLERITMRHS